MLAGEIHAFLEQVDHRLSNSHSTLEFWWRDDDFASNGKALDSLKRSAESAELVPLLAAIPQRVVGSQIRRLGIPDEWLFSQHGWMHRSCETPGRPRSEFGDGRSEKEVRSDLSAGRHRLQEIFGSRYLDVFVPPWSNFASCHEAVISDLGYHGFSCSGIGARAGIAAPTIQENVHIDLLQWGGPAGPIPAGPDKIIGSLERCLLRPNDAREQVIRVGVLTHHQGMNEQAFGLFLDFVAATKALSRAAWISPHTVFPAQTG